MNNRHYHSVVRQLRAFFEDWGFIEIPVQHRLSILAACEDPRTISTFQYSGQVWPLPQTGQMHLETELLKNPDYPGVFCISTSYRQEPHPIHGRHDLIFPMFEFEGRGDVHNLMEIEADLLLRMEFDIPFAESTYDTLCSQFGVQELTHEHEERIGESSKVLFLTKFPERTSPFWNMRRLDNDLAAKVDVIIHGIETIGSAERETDPVVMRERFRSISGGRYAELLYAQFTEERVNRELEEFLALPFTPRYGGGIGITRMIRGLLLDGVLK